MVYFINNINYTMKHIMTHLLLIFFYVLIKYYLKSKFTKKQLVEGL